MGSVIQASATGSGSLAITGGQLINEIDVLVTTLADLYTPSGGPPYRRIYQQGRIGLAYLQGSTQHYVEWDHFIEHDLEIISLELTNGVFANELFWEIAPGGDVQLIAWWA